MTEKPLESTPGGGTATAADRRSWPRAEADALAAVKAELAAGDAITLKDLSRGGARFQSTTRLLPGLTVALRLLTPNGVITIRGRVVRSRLTRLDVGGMGYEVGVSFNDLIGPVVGEMSAEAPASTTRTTSPAEPVAPQSAAGEPAAPASPGASAPSIVPAPVPVSDTQSSRMDDDIRSMITLTAVVSVPHEALHELFAGNSW